MPLISPYAGKPVDRSRLADIPRLVTAYFTDRPDPRIAAQRVSFGTSGHRGSSLRNSFNEAHILAISQAVCQHRAAAGIDGPLFIGIDTHALSAPALATTLEVLTANNVETFIDAQDGYTPTPVISHAILGYNRGRTEHMADGIVITPSHNPPEDGGYKYNPPHGGPADTATTKAIEAAANAFLTANLAGISRIPLSRARQSPNLHRHDYLTPYVADLATIIDMEAVRASGIRIGIDPLGGASVAYWPAIVDQYKLTAATVVNTIIDPAFAFMTADWDGQIRMDCSSPHAMGRLIGMRDDFDIAFANDTDADRHGIVAGASGLMNPNHFLAVAIDYLFIHRPAWPVTAGIGKTVVSSGLIDRVAARLHRPLVEVPVGFKWFVDGLLTGSMGFAGEESAGASFLRHNGTTWTTDKDGLIAGLLAAEMTARGNNPGTAYQALAAELGTPYYARTDAAATPAQKGRLLALRPDQLDLQDLAGEPIRARLTTAPGNNAPIGGLKITADNGWFAARPSGTEDVYKIYAESFRSEAHLHRIQQQAESAINSMLSKQPDLGVPS